MVTSDHTQAGWKRAQQLMSECDGALGRNAMLAGEAVRAAWSGSRPPTAACRARRTARTGRPRATAGSTASAGRSVPGRRASVEEHAGHGGASVEEGAAASFGRLAVLVGHDVPRGELPLLRQCAHPPSHRPSPRDQPELARQASPHERPQREHRREPRPVPATTPCPTPAAVGRPSRRAGGPGGPSPAAAREETAFAARRSIWRAAGPGPLARATRSGRSSSPGYSTVTVYRSALARRSTTRACTGVPSTARTKSQVE